jgi:hypothetical protein
MRNLFNVPCEQRFFQSVDTVLEVPDFGTVGGKLVFREADASVAVRFHKPERQIPVVVEKMQELPYLSFQVWFFFDDDVHLVHHCLEPFGFDQLNVQIFQFIGAGGSAGAASVVAVPVDSDVVHNLLLCGFAFVF